MNNIFDYVELLANNVWLYGGTFVIVLSILVFIHEWGHYIVARMCGVKIEVFSIGFGKEVFGFNDKHGTRWKFSLIPLGGYVQMFGDADPTSFTNAESSGDDSERKELKEEERKLAFFAKPVGQRAAIAFAGPAVNFIFAIVLFAALFTFYGEEVSPAKVVGVVQESAAERAGFEPGDVVIEINGDEIASFEDIKRKAMVSLDQPMDVVVERGGDQIDLAVQPDVIEASDRFGFRHSHGYLGLLGPVQQGMQFNIDTISKVNGVEYDSVGELRQALVANAGKSVSLEFKQGEGLVETHEHEHDEHENENEDAVEMNSEEASLNVVNFFIDPELNQDLISGTESEDGYFLVVEAGYDAYVKEHNLFTGFIASVSRTWDVVADTLTALWQMVTGVRGVDELGGIIRIGAIAGEMASVGFVALVSFTALLSINLGLINLFPIPLLDGGHLLFYLIEAIRGGKPVSERVQEYAFRFGMVFIVGLMLFANLNDVVQLLM